MAEGTEKNDGVVGTEREEIFSKSVRAGKRTYFFDVKTTRRNDYYLTLTESKKRFNRDGRFYFEKHKIFLYKEDFDKFTEGLTEVIEYIKANAPEILEPDETDNGKAVTPKPEVDSTDTKDSGIIEEQSTSQENESVDESSETKSESSVEEEGEPITENFSNIEFEDLEDKKDT